MGILIDEETRVLVQGITGKQGSRATEEMLESGIKVTCGVTPGKGGQEVCDLPVYNTVKEAKLFDKKLNTSVLYVPPLFVLSAAKEAIENDIKLIIIFTENVPIKDTATMIALAKKKGCRILGPSSVGVLSPGMGKLGSIGGANINRMFKKGNVGIISKSGGMCAETALLLTQNKIGQSTVIGIGGDPIMGTSFADLLIMFENDEQTKAVVVFGEIGGTYEEQIARLVASKKFTKPVVAAIMGTFAESLGREMAFGHAGAIVERGMGTTEQKKEALRNAGVHVANYHHEIPTLIQKALKK